MASRAVENFYEPGPPAENRSSRVLIHAPFGRDGALLCDVLARAGIEALACGSLDQTCADFHAGAAALLVGDEALNEGGMERLRRMLSQQPPWSDIPLFVMTRRADSTARYHFLKRFDVLGNVSLLDRPLRAKPSSARFRWHCGRAIGNTTFAIMWKPNAGTRPPWRAPTQNSGAPTKT